MLVHIERVSRTFEFHVDTLKEAVAEAARLAAEFYGDAPFRIRYLHVEGATYFSGDGKHALVVKAFTESEHGPADGR